MTDRDVVGQVGEVVARVRGPAGPGEVRVMLRGCHALLLAYSDSYLEPGEEVLVINQPKAGSVDVVPWPLTTLLTGSLGAEPLLPGTTGEEEG